MWYACDWVVPDKSSWFIGDYKVTHQYRCNFSLTDIYRERRAVRNDNSHYLLRKKPSLPFSGCYNKLSEQVILEMLPVLFLSAIISFILKRTNIRFMTEIQLEMNHTGLQWRLKEKKQFSWRETKASPQGFRLQSHLVRSRGQCNTGGGKWLQPRAQAQGQAPGQLPLQKGEMVLLLTRQGQ